MSIQSATLLVGTHKDLVSDEAVESLDNALQKKVKNSSLPKSEIIHYPNPDEKQTPPFKLVVPIDNTNKLDPGISLLQDLISNTLDKIDPVQIPIPWLMFEHSVRSTGRRILSFRECAVIGKECGIESDEELKTALWFLSQQFGTLRYYPNVAGMEGIVIVDVQVLFNTATCLIKACYLPRRGGCTAIDIQFCDTGRCPKGSAEKLLQCEGDIPPAQLLRLFEHLRLLTPVKDEDGKVTEYFVPTVLRSFEVETLHRPSSNCGRPAPLLYQFSCGFCPLGFFHFLVVYLTSPQLHSELEWDLCKGELFRNKVTFRVGDDYDKVTLIARPTFYEVWIEREDDKDPEIALSQVCSLVRSTINEGITVVKASLNSVLSIDHHIAFYCQRPNCDSTPHLAVPRGIRAKKAVCSFAGKPSVLSPEQRVWFGEVGVAGQGLIVWILRG